MTIAWKSPVPFDDMINEDHGCLIGSTDSYFQFFFPTKIVVPNGLLERTVQNIPYLNQNKFLIDPFNLFIIINGQNRLVYVSVIVYNLRI